MPGPEGDGRATRRPSTSAARSERGPPSRDRPAPGRRATRSRPRSATRRRSRIASTSSRRTGPTTRSSATSPRATASRTLPLPRGGHAQPPRPGQRVRAARQLLRRGRGQRRRARVVDGGLRHRLRRADLAALLPGRPPGPLSGRRGQSARSPGPPAATSGTAPPPRGSATGATASSSRTARPPTTPAPRRSRP